MAVFRPTKYCRQDCAPYYDKRGEDPPCDDCEQAPPLTDPRNGLFILVYSKATSARDGDGCLDDGALKMLADLYGLTPDETRNVIESALLVEPLFHARQAVLLERKRPNNG